MRVVRRQCTSDRLSIRYPPHRNKYPLHDNQRYTYGWSRCIPCIHRMYASPLWVARLNPKCRVQKVDLPHPFPHKDNPPRHPPLHHPTKDHDHPAYHRLSLSHRSHVVQRYRFATDHPSVQMHSPLPDQHLVSLGSLLHLEMCRSQ